MDQIKIAEATLSNYEAFKVSDNWLSEELQDKMWDDSSNNEVGNTNDIYLVSDGAQEGEGRFSQSGEGSDSSKTSGESVFRDDGKSEPWDDFGDETRKDVDYDRRNIMEVPFPSKGAYNSDTERIRERNGKLFRSSRKR